jgi:hypothetical protein
LSAALIGGFSIDWLIADHCLPGAILPIDNEYDIYSPDEFEFA